MYETLERSFRESPDPVYRLRTPWLTPCTLAEHHTVDGNLQSLTLAYGTWDTDQPHIRVTTWRDLPGQDFSPDELAEPEEPDAPRSAATEQVTADIAGTPQPGTLRRHPSGRWFLRADLGAHHLLASGRGPIGDLSFDPLTDLQEAVDARRAYLASRFPDAP
ncbi:hypothetical protein SAMN05216499_112219 [Actinacidiphila paucisporea]|uniref:Uncharacterized protein n=2 Tax=Actinacidiphila paucisporea TaxID=310782 RepID=A0A1M7KCN7_9ACTN|nr:hypothetical protein SAMN05216499_112219 [Actinacidiphila paucisporea]